MVLFWSDATFDLACRIEDPIPTFDHLPLCWKRCLRMGGGYPKRIGDEATPVHYGSWWSGG